MHHLCRLRDDITLLQKTHLQEGDFQRMKRLWVGQVVGSPAKGKKAGVLILIHKNIQGEIGRVTKDETGRVLTVQVTIGTTRWALTNIYAPNEQNKATYQELSKGLLDQDQDKQIVKGDFNEVMLREEERRSTMRKTKKVERTGLPP